MSEFQMSEFQMPIERASEKEPVARPSSNKDVAELLRSRKELDRRLAMLNSERGLFEKLLRMDDSRSSNSPTLWQRRLTR